MSKLLLFEVELEDGSWLHHGATDRKVVETLYPDATKCVLVGPLTILGQICPECLNDLPEGMREGAVYCCKRCGDKAGARKRTKAWRERQNPPLVSDHG